MKPSGVKRVGPHGTSGNGKGKGGKGDGKGEEMGSDQVQWMTRVGTRVWDEEIELAHNSGWRRMGVGSAHEPDPEKTSASQRSAR